MLALGMLYKHTWTLKSCPSVKWPTPALLPCQPHSCAGSTGLISSNSSPVATLGTREHTRGEFYKSCIFD